MKKGIILINLILIGSILLINSAAARTFTIRNNSGQQICPGVWSQNYIPNSGGWCMNDGETVVLSVPDNWTAVKIWGRTCCDTVNKQCATGDCGGKIECNGASGRPPITLAEFTLKGASGLDYYDLSLVEGYNIGISVSNTGGKKSGDGSQYDCGSPNCTGNINAGCPAGYQIKYGGAVVACRNITPDKPSAVSAWYKSQCPDAYSYSYDDTTSTYTCKGGNYIITFTPTPSSCRK